MFIPFDIDTEDRHPMRQQRAWAVWAIIALCVLVHAGVHHGLDTDATQDVIYRFGAARFPFRWWSLLTCAFLHAGWVHLITNMYVLWVYGRHLERYLGTGLFLAVYLGAGTLSIAAHLATVAPYLADEPAVGASGAISAVLGAFLVAWPTARVRSLFFSPLSFRPLIVHIPSWVILGLWFSGQLVHSLQLLGELEGVAFWAHAAGFAAGAAGAALILHMRRRQEEAEAAALRQPLIEAWDDLRAERRAEARRRLADVDGSILEDLSGTRALLAALASDPGAVRCGHALRAFCQARDYRRSHAALTAYHLLCTWTAPSDVPPAVHREAGFAAARLRQDRLALDAFQRAADAGESVDNELVTRAIEGCRTRLGRGPASPEEGHRPESRTCHGSPR